MDTGKPALGKRVLSSFFALTLVMGLVPVSAYAEVGKAQEQQGQEQSEQSAAVSGESASQDAASDATQQGGVSSGSKDEAASGSASGTETGVAETPKSSGSASSSEKAVDNAASTSNGEAATQSADNGVAVQADSDKRYIETYNGDDVFTKKQVYNLIRENFGKYTRYKINGGEYDNENISTWALDSGKFKISDSAEYAVSGASTFGSWSVIGTLIFQKTWKTTFSSNIPEGGVEVIGSTLTDNVVTTDDGTMVKFKVKDVNGKKATVTRVVGSESTELKADSDGVYSVMSDKNSTIKVDYAVGNATLTANFDNASVSIEGIEGSLTSDTSVDIAAGYEKSATIKPEGNFAITSAVLSDGKGNEWELVKYSSFSKDRVATVTIPELEAGVSYTLKVETEECKLVLKDNASVAAKNITDADDLKKRIIAGTLDVDASFPPVNPDKLTVKYNAGLGSWQNLDFVPSKWDFALHQFGKNGDTEEVRISYGGNNQYCALNAETKITIVKTATEMVVDPSSVSVPFGTTVDALKDEILKNMTVKDAVSGKAVDVADSDISIEGYDIRRLESKP